MKKFTPLGVACMVTAACAAVMTGIYFLTVAGEAGGVSNSAAVSDSVKAAEDGATLADAVSADAVSKNAGSRSDGISYDISPDTDQSGEDWDISAGLQAWTAQKYDAAYEIFKKGTEEGSLQAMTALGYLYLSGSGTQMDVQHGLQLYRMAAAGGEPYAMYGLAEYLRKNPSAESEPGEGLEMLKTAAVEKKLPAACRDYYEILLEEGKTDEAKEFLKKNAEDGQNWAVTTYGIAMCNGSGADLDVEAGLELLKKSARNGDVTAAYGAGCVEMRRGRVGSAELLFNTAAKQNYGPALIALGRLYLQRDEVKKGMEFFMKAGQNGSPEAFVLLGKLSEAGKSVPRDPAAAAKYYRMAAEKNDADGYNELARLTESGTGVKQSLQEAYRLYSEGAAAGSSEALYNQGRMEIYGAGTEQNMAAGVEKIQESAQRGEPEARTLLGTMYARGDFFTKSIDEAERLYREAAAQGDAEAQYLLGGLLRSTGTVDNLKEAMKFYRLAADQGSAQAQYALGQCYADGSWHEPDTASAVKWYSLAARQEFPAAMCSMGLLMLDVASNDAKVKEAVGMIEKAAAKGFMPAEFALGQICEQGRIGKKNITKAVDHYLHGARGGDPESQVRMAGILSRGEFETPVDLNESFKWYLAAARQGNSLAQCNTAAMYFSGQGTTKDLAQAAAWYKTAAEQGNALAQYNYGMMCLRGIGVEKDEKQGLQYLEKAGNAGYAPAQNELGTICSKGNFVEQNFKEAQRWFQLAADNGNVSALYNLGLLYSSGREGDPSDAISCFEQAAAQGHVLAAWHLGIAYEKGLGTTKDLDKAQEYYQAAADAGDENAQAALARIVSQNGQQRIESGAAGQDVSSDQPVSADESAAPENNS
jgi:TPR repeat protein